LLCASRTNQELLQHLGSTIIVPERIGTKLGLAWERILNDAGKKGLKTKKNTRQSDSGDISKLIKHRIYIHTCAHRRKNDFIPGLNVLIF